jgi:hypothetical protein
VSYLAPHVNRFAGKKDPEKLLDQRGVLGHNRDIGRGTGPRETKMTKRQATKAEKLLTANPELSARDARDLLMEYGFDGITASSLTQDRA